MSELNKELNGESTVIAQRETLSAKCMDGPTSLPTGMPLPRARVRPMTLAIKAFRVKYSFSTTPLRMVFSSGIPEPEAPGKERGLIKI